MQDIKAEKIRESIRHIAAEFLSEVDEGTSLITVTGVLLSPKTDQATILITVLPEEKEKDALTFTKRQTGHLRKRLGERLAIHHLPFLSFVIDRGEKNRQLIDRLSQSS
ncbi:MAG: ribosome-binding factor A [bacterium]|nr:ribosome-binding factor A [bacterium]